LKTNLNRSLHPPLAIFGILEGYGLSGKMKTVSARGRKGKRALKAHERILPELFRSNSDEKNRKNIQRETISP